MKSYPHTDSNIPNSIAYSAFVGQLHRFYRVSSTSSLFLRDAVELACYLIMNNGCKQELLIRKFYSFCRKVVRSKYDLKLYTLRQMFVNDVPARLFHLHSPTTKSLLRYITSDTRDASHVPPLGDLDKQMNLFLESFNTRTHGSAEASTASTSSDDSATALGKQSRYSSTPRTWDSF